MTRRLLPYEYQLIEALGVTEEEYLDFVQAQFDHSRLPQDKTINPQCDPGTVALIMTIVGTLLQVGAALLMPRPEVPSQKALRGRREQVFSPRFGFNSTQELAKYGDVVNLVYCNTSQNPLGGVRVSTSLIWSAVKSFGSSQFMQTLSVIGAASIKKEGIDFRRIAFGQTPVKEFELDNLWIYTKQSGLLTFSDLAYGKGSIGNIKDPTGLDGPSAVTPAYRAQIAKTTFREGFSQAFSPSTFSKCGVFSPVPINVNYVDRDEKGKLTRTDDGLGINIRIDIADIENNKEFATYWPKEEAGYPAFNRVACPVGATFELAIGNLYDSTKTQEDNPTKRAASDLRRQYASSMDFSSIYKLGGARFRITNISGDIDYDELGGMRVKFECVQSGFCPTEDYGTEHFRQNENEAAAEIDAINDEILRLQSEIITLIPSQNSQAQGIQQRLDALRVLEDLVDDYTDKKWTTAEIDQIMSGMIGSDEAGYLPSSSTLGQATLDFAKKVDEAREERRSLQAAIDDILEVPVNQRDSLFGNNWKKTLKNKKEKKAEWDRKLKRRQAKMSAAFRNEGFRDSAIGTSTMQGNLRADKKELRRLRNQYHGEIAQLLDEAARIDTVTTNAEYQSIQAQIDDLIQSRSVVEASLKNEKLLNDYFDTKCLVKIEEAKYETITKSQVVEFALKARIYMRVQGRAPTYGETDVPNHKVSDNGYKLRSMFFWVWYREVVDYGAQEESGWRRASHIFVIRRSSENDHYVYLRFVKPDNTKNWEFRFDPIADVNAEMSYYGVCDFAYIENSGEETILNQGSGISFSFIGKQRARNDARRLPPLNDCPAEIDEWSLFSVRSDTQINFSFDGGPELEVKAVTEQQLVPVSTFNDSLYDDLTLFGFNVYSGQGIQDLRSMSVYINEGKLARRINDDATITPNKTGPLDPGEGYPTSLAPEIFLDTALDPTNGVGRYSKLSGLDLRSLAKAKRFCVQNSFFMDCVIADPESWRQFWAQVAPYSLLEFGRIGGRDTLIPAIPSDEDGTITREVPITALFNAGNILEDSYKEEYIDYGTSSQDLIATVIYRETERDQTFPRNRSVDIYLKDTIEVDAIRQTFDLSQYVTNRDQAIAYGKLLCQQRKNIRKNIEFRTFPTDSPISPGSYIFVDIGQQEWQNIYSGIIEPGGKLNTPMTTGIPNGSYSILIYSLANQNQSTSSAENNTISTTVTIASNTSAALQNYAGRLFVLGTTNIKKRVFRINEISMDEEGEVTVRGTEHPCEMINNIPYSLIADFSDNKFTVT